MKDIIENVENLLSDFQPEHSQFQIENFIIGTNNHIWERYKQALRELSARHDDMIASEMTIEEIKKTRGKNWIRRLFAKTKVSEKQLKNLEKKHASKKREYIAFYEIARGLKNIIGEIDNEKRQRLEAEAWTEKALMIAAIDYISIGGLQRTTAEFIISFPKEIRKKILNNLKPENRQGLLSVLEK